MELNMKMTTNPSVEAMKSNLERRQNPHTHGKDRILLMAVFVLALSLGLAPRLRADVSVFQEGVGGYTGAQDTELREAPADQHAPGECGQCDGGQ